jgi:hypothetical protein
MNRLLLASSPEEGDDYLDLRSADLADELGLCPDLLKETICRNPTLGPIVSRQQLLDLIALLEREQRQQEDDHER